MNKATILDRDGTINIDYGYVYRIEDFVFIAGVFNDLRRLQNTGFLLFVYTNQSGIGRGLYSEEDFLNINNHMLEELKKNGINIAEVMYCPHSSEADCNCRKPNTGLLEKAILSHHIDRNNSYVIGDKDSDYAFGVNAGMKSIMIEMNRGITKAVDLILENEKRRT